MAGRDLLHDATRHHFVGDFASCSVADRALFGLVTRQCHHLADLFGGDLRGAPGARNIAQSLSHIQVSQVGGLQRKPARTPGANRIHTYMQVVCNLRIVPAFCCCQDHSPAQSLLLGGVVPTHQRFQFLLFPFAQGQFLRFWASQVFLASSVLLAPFYSRRISAAMY